MDDVWDWWPESPTPERTRLTLDGVPNLRAAGRRSAQVRWQLVAVSLGRWWADHPIAVPAWITPLAIANLALYIVFILDHQNTYRHPLLVLASTGALLTLVAALFVALIHRREGPAPRGQRVATLALVGVLTANTTITGIRVLPHLAQTNRYTTDAAAATDCGATLFIHGQSPYNNLHMLTCLQHHGLGPAQTTPKRAGTFWVFATYPSPINAHFQYLLYRVYWRELQRERHNPSYRSPEFETRFNYPGGAILIAALALKINFRDLVPLYLGCTLAALLLIYRRSERRARLVLALLLLGNAPLLVDEVGGTTDSLYGLILVLYWQCRSRVLFAGLLLGLAAATRQQVWFFLPFLLFLGWRGGGWPDLARRAGGTLTAFLACNLPFIAAGPGDWLTGVLGPVRDPLFAEGIGLVALSISKILPLWPATVYTGLELLLFVVAFIFFTRRYAAVPGLAMILPLLPLIFAWRSLLTYFLLLPVLAAAVLVEQDANTAAATAQQNCPTRPRGLPPAFSDGYATGIRSHRKVLSYASTTSPDNKGDDHVVLPSLRLQGVRKRGPGMSLVWLIRHYLYPHR